MEHNADELRLELDRVVGLHEIGPSEPDFSEYERWENLLRLAEPQAALAELDRVRANVAKHEAGLPRPQGGARRQYRARRQRLRALRSEILAKPLAQTPVKIDPTKRLKDYTAEERFERERRLEQKKAKRGDLVETVGQLVTEHLPSYQINFDLDGINAELADGAELLYDPGWWRMAQFPWFWEREYTSPDRLPAQVTRRSLDVPWDAPATQVAEVITDDLMRYTTWIAAATGADPRIFPLITAARQLIEAWDKKARADEVAERLEALKNLARQLDVG